jgi:HEAT repeat protein
VFHFDLISALLGFLLAWLLMGLLYRQRARLASLRDALWARAGAVRRFLVSGAEYRYRHNLGRSLQGGHLAGRIVDLEAIAVTPRLLLPTPIPEPGEGALVDPDTTYVVPTFPDLPELAALYGVPTCSLDDALKSPASLLLIGRPGAGKSTILSLMAARLVEEAAVESTGRTPLLAHMGDIELPQDLTAMKDAAEPLLLAAEARMGLFGGAGAAEHLHRRLKDGECLLLLDGWDDLPSAHQAELIHWLKTFLAAYPNNRLIATGPATGYRPLLALGFTVVPVAGWTPDDFRLLVERWTTAWPDVVARRKRKPAPGEADPGLIAGWLSGGSRGRTPLDITLRIWTALEGDVLGPRPADWLSAYVTRLLPSPDGLRALEQAALESLGQERFGIGRDQLRDLANVAFAMSASALPMDPNDFLEAAEQRGGLLVKRANNRASFSHPLVADYLAVAPFATSNRPDPFLHETDPAHGPVFPLYASLGDATPLALARLQKPPDMMHSDLIGLAQWLPDSPSNARWRAEVLRRLAGLMMAAEEPELLRGRALAALVGARDETVNQFFKQALESEDVVARTYAALGLGASGDPAYGTLLAARLTDRARPVQWAAALALGSIGDAAAVRALTNTMAESDEGLRRAAAEVLSTNREEGFHLLREALSANDLLTRRAAIFGLRRMGPNEEILKLLNDVHFNDTQWVVRGAAEEALNVLKAPDGRGPAAQPPPEQIGWLVAWAASRGEGVAPGDAGRYTLRRALVEGDEETQIAAALTLARLAFSEAVPDLQNAMRSGSADVREAAFRALFEISLAAARRITAAGTAPL